MSNPSPAPTSSARRVERSCALCHRRKVRCDKQSPCSQCTRGGYSCVYPQPGRNVRRPRKTTINDVASRISELEKTLSAVSGDHDVLSMIKQSPSTTTPRSDGTSRAPESEISDTSPSNEILLRKGSSSRYFNEALLSRVIEQEHDVRTALATPRSESPEPLAASPFNPMGILSGKFLTIPIHSYHPSQLAVMQLWKVYVDNIDPCTKILHIPTDEILVYTVAADPSRASAESLGLCYAIYYLAIIALEPSDAQAITGEEKNMSLHRFKTGLEQALAHADFLESPTVILLQALAIYLSALRVRNSGRAIWTLLGLAIRAAQSMGLHRDGNKLGLSPFESEVRRRLWWHLLGRDARAVEDYGLQNTSAPGLMSGVNMPLNLEDSDIYPEMKELPPPRAGWTRMTLALVNIEITRAWAELSQLTSFPTNEPPREADRVRIVGSLTGRMENVLRYCNPVVPQQHMTVTVARFLLRKLDLVTRQQWRSLNHVGDQKLLATEDNLLETLDVLENVDTTWDDDLLRAFRWSMRSYPQYHMMLYILWHLCIQPEGPSVRRALAAVNTHLEKTHLAEKGPFQGSKWAVLMALKAKATDITQKLQRRSASGPEGNGIIPVDATTNMGSTSNAGLIERNDLFRNDGTQNFPDWNTLLQDFQLDGTDFSIMD